MKWIELDMTDLPLGYAVVKEIDQQGKINLVVGEFYESGFIAYCYDESVTFDFTPFWKYYYVSLGMSI